MGPWESHGVGKVALRRSGFALRTIHAMGQIGKNFYVHFRAFQINKDTLLKKKKNLFAQTSRKRSTKPKEAKRPSSPAGLA